MCCSEINKDPEQVDQLINHNLMPFDGTISEVSVHL